VNDPKSRSTTSTPKASPIDQHRDEQFSVTAELQQQQQRAELFAEVTVKIRQSLQLKDIFKTTVSEVQRILKADRVLIYQVLPDKTGKTVSEAVLADFPAILDREFPEEVFPLDYQALYAKGRVQAINDVHDPRNGVASCLIEFVDQFSVKAKLIVPILINFNAAPAIDGSQSNNQLWGLLIAHHCQAPHSWSEFELELMQQLADQIGIAIFQGELLENLEDLVAARTHELRQVNGELKQEIRDRQQAEQGLRNSEEQLRLITNALPALIAYIDSNQQYQFNNQAYQTWLGKSPEMLRNQHLKSVWSKDYYQRIAPWVQKALSGEIVTYENEIQLLDGSSRSVSVTYIPHRDDTENSIKGFFALTNDISDRKAIERMKDEFISVVSHELRTPLTSIHSALKILASGKLGSLSSQGQQMIEIADDNTDRLVRLVNNVLDLQRIEAGSVTMDRKRCDAATIMITATEAMQAMAHQQQVTLGTEPISRDIWVDSDYIVQTITNLLSNAVKFSPPHSTVWLSAQQRPDSQIQFQVRDEGPGIPVDQLECIFERFHQIDSSDSRKKGGTGLGLTICRKIIEQHGGQIWAESVPGQGSCFIFTLPVLTSENTENNES
jgi:two-component system, OmpR family, sensor histidine kinase VicK